MPWKNGKYDYDTFDIEHANQKLNDYDKDLLDYDYYWYKNKYDKTKFKLIQRRIKLLINPFGKSYLPLRIYKNLETNENICPVKQAIGIPKYKNCTNRLTLFIIKEIHKGKRQCDIKDMLPYCNISKQTYSNIIKNTKIEIQLPINKYEVKDYLHIDMDDCFEYLANEQGIIEKYCIRIFSLYTHKINIYKNRNQLQNKIWAYMIFKPSDNITQDKVYEFIYETIVNNYDFKINHLTDIFWQNNNLIIAGDGALWIRAMAKWFGGKYVLDCFHGISYLWKSFINVKGKKKADTNWPNYFDTSFNFKNGNYNELMSLLKDKVNKQTFNYFANNEQGIINQGKDWNIGCHAESTVSHLVKSLKGGGVDIVQGNPKFGEYWLDYNGTAKQIFNGVGYDYDEFNGINYENKTKTLMNNKFDMQTTEIKITHYTTYLYRMFDMLVTSSKNENGKVYWNGIGERPYSFEFIPIAMVDQLVQDELINSRLNNGTMSIVEAISLYENIDTLMAKQKLENIINENKFLNKHLGDNTNDNEQRSKNSINETSTSSIKANSTINKEM